MSDTEYPIVILALSDEDGGGFSAHVPDLPGCAGDGATRAQAVADVESAIGEWIDEATAAGIDIPAPGSSATKIREERSAIRQVMRKQEGLIKTQDTLLKAKEQQLERMREELDELQAAIEGLQPESDLDEAIWIAAKPVVIAAFGNGKRHSRVTG
jgi:antitoxin HicB